MPNARYRRFKGHPLILAAVAFLFSGCGTASNAKRNEILKSAGPADYGPPPPANHHAVEIQLLRKRLRDPDSMKIDYGRVGKVTIRALRALAFHKPEVVPVWISGIKVNAKNGFGGYTGYQPYYFAWKNGRIIAVMGENIPERDTDYIPMWESLR